MYRRGGRKETKFRSNGAIASRGLGSIAGRGDVSRVGWATTPPANRLPARALLRRLEGEEKL
eukprot:4107501-Prymnesium_polylepis.1